MDIFIPCAYFSDMNFHAGMVISFPIVICPHIVQLNRVFIGCFFFVALFRLHCHNVSKENSVV